MACESTNAKDRKRIVRLLIKDITVKISDNRKSAFSILDGKVALLKK